jgi:hypothetical protein
VNEVANTILKQLGGGTFCVMVGAKFITALPNGISLKIMRNVSKATHIRITLDTNDLYHVEFIKCRGVSISTVKEFENVYFDQLVSIFEQTTQLYTRLF